MVFELFPLPVLLARGRAGKTLFASTNPRGRRKLMTGCRIENEQEYYGLTSFTDGKTISTASPTVILHSAAAFPA